MLVRNEQVSDGPKGEERESVILRSMCNGVPECMDEQKEKSSWGWNKHAVGLAFALWFVCLSILTLFSGPKGIFHLTKWLKV